MPANLVRGNTVNTLADYILSVTASGASPSPAASPTASPTATASPTTATGATLFTKDCASCHTLKAADATGTGGPDLDTLAKEGKLSEQLLVTTIEKGHGGMPAITQEPDATIIADYVLSVAGKS